MDRKRQVLRYILTAAIFITPGCQHDIHEAETYVCNTFLIQTEECMTRSLNSPSYENMMTDINLMVFHNGEIECHEWIRTADAASDVEVTLNLQKDREYTFCVIANIGSKVMISDLEGLLDFQVNVDHDYAKGIPMSCIYHGKATGHIDMSLKRMMSKISVRFDRSRLSEDVRINVTGIRIGNSPKTVKAFLSNKPQDMVEINRYGDSRNEKECNLLNISGTDGMSGDITLYAPENMQGEFPYRITDESQKIFPEGSPMSGLCSYLEIECRYVSPTHCSMNGNLLYRVYLGEDTQNLDVERDCHYHIVVTPEGDGISGDGWKTDKTYIAEYSPSIIMYPGSYMEGRVGERLHIWCETLPPDADVDIGMEELEFEKERGIFDYVADEDGRGFVLSLKKPGTAIVYMSAGYPINESIMGVIVVNP